MRTFVWVPMLFLYQNALSQIKKIPTETTVQTVTIFSSGARVDRISSVSISPGRSEITFSGLSNQLDQKSVQLNADADITLLSVQASKDFLSERKINDEEKNFIEKTKALQDKLDMDNKLLQVYKSEEEMLKKNEAIGGTTGVKTTELKEALDLHRQRLTEVYEKQIEIQNRINFEQKDMTRFAEQLQQISKKRDSINYIVTALVESKETRNVNFHLFYNVKDAGWYPSYDVRVKDVTTPLNVLMNASVFQRSGETWKNISILLSTGNPNDNATPSQLQPWKLNFFDPSVSFRNQGTRGLATGRVTNDKGEPIPGATVLIRGTNSGTGTDNNGFFRLENVSSNSVIHVSMVGYESKEVRSQPGYFTIALEPTQQALQEVVVMGYGTAKALEGRAAGVVANNENQKKNKGAIKPVTVATQYEPTTTVYKIQDKYNLETDGKTTTIGIKQFEIPALYNYFSVPKIDPSAFLSANIVNWQDYDLQSGEASLYYEGSYLGKTYIDLGSASDTLSLSLGKDNGIKISRKTVKEYSSKHFIGSNKTETKTYEITVRNNKRVPVTLNLTDQAPVSVTKEIDVDDIKTPEAQYDKETGIATWNITLQSGDEKKLQIGYSVKYPKDKKVVLE
ncbi:MAG: mucoidy inhibitor MuiA family protein [Ginsengibacter sp.]